MTQEKKEKKAKNKITSFHSYQDDQNDQELDRFLRESICKEADEFEERLSSDPKLAGISASDDMFRMIVARLKEQGYWEEDCDTVCEDTEDEIKNTNEEDSGRKEAVINGQEEQVEHLLRLIEKGRKAEQDELKNAKKRIRRNQLLKRAAMIAAVFVLIIGAGFSTEASRGWVLKMWDVAMEGFGFKAKTNNAYDIVVTRVKSEEEQQALEAIKENMQVPIPDFEYMPEGMEFLDYQIIKPEWDIMMHYAYHEKIASIEIVKLGNDSSFYYTSNEEVELVEQYEHVLGIEIEIWKLLLGQNVENYMIEFEYEGCRYILNGSLPLEEIKQMLKYMIFL